MDVKYPKIYVDLTTIDGNAFMIIGVVCKALRRGDVSVDEINSFTEEAMSGDYDHLLQTVMRTVTC